MKQLRLWLLLVPLSMSSVWANNIAVSNVRLTGQNTTDDFTLVEFDISWDNSWRTSQGPSNWDAAWVFVKYRLKTQTTWNHASLNWVDGTGSGDGHTVPPNASISSANDQGSNSYGVFIYHNTDMAQGSVSYPDVQLRWNYGVDGLADGDSVEICVFAIEMVYVPQGNFSLGSGGNEAHHFYEYPNTNTPYVINSNAAFSIGTNPGDLYSTATGSNALDPGTISQSYPKGYNAFYCMKYEISQQQYTDFLNKLTPTLDSYRFPGQNGSFRHAITGSAGNRTTSNPNVACGYLSMVDICAYLDWAALRPMSELEFEKACRGTLAPVSGEYVWGTSNRATNAYTLSNAGAANEGIATNYSTNAGNAIYSSTKGSIDGPLRCGIFAANSNNLSRETAGATYYGIMNMGDNVLEYVINIVDDLYAQGYNGQHGNGEIDANNGESNVFTWFPMYGGGFRGGSFRSGHGSMKTSTRDQANIGIGVLNSRDEEYGGRGVRSAP